MSATIDHKLASMQKEMELAKKRAAESDEEKASLLQTIEELKNQILNQKSSKECSKIAVKPQEDKEKLRLHQQIDTLQKDNKDLQEKLKAAISTPQEKSTAVVEQYNKLQQQTLEAKKEAEKAKQQADEAKKETEKTKQQLAEVAQEKQSFEDAFKTRESQYKELSAINEALASEIETLKIALDEKEELCQNLSAEKEVLKLGLKEKQDYLDNRLQSNTNEEGLINTLKNQIKNSVAKVKTEGYPNFDEIQNLHKKIVEINQKLGPLATEFENLREAIRKDYDDFTITEENIKRKKEIFQEHCTSFESLKERYNAIKNNIEVYKLDFAKFSATITSYLSHPFNEAYNLQLAVKSELDWKTLKNDDVKYNNEFKDLTTSHKSLIDDQGICSHKLFTINRALGVMKNMLDNPNASLLGKFTSFFISPKEKDPAKTN